MTSKEAITDLEHFFNTKENLNGVLSSQTRKAGMERINVIKQDLDVLEIIRNHKLLNYILKNDKCAKMYHLTENEILFLKERFKNDDQSTNS